MAEAQDGTSDEVASLRALAHPLRLRMLSLLTGAELSAAEVARELGITHANASYHLRALLAADLLEVAGEERIRGGVAKRYRHPWERPGRTSSPAEHDLEIEAVAQELVRRSRLRAVPGRNMLTDAEMWVLPEVRDEVWRLVHEASTLIHREARPPRTEGTVHVNLTAALFELATEPPQDRP